MIRTFAAAAVVATAGSLASPVQAAPAGWVKVSPDPVVVYPDRSTWVTVTVDFGTDRKIYGTVLAEMKPAGGGGYNYGNLSDPDGDGIWVGRIKFDDGSAGRLGRWNVETSAIAEDTSETLQGPTGGFRLSGATRTTAAVKPKSVARGGSVKVSGKVSTFLQFGYFSGSAGRSVKVYFRKSGAKKWVYASSARTDASGRYAVVVRPKQSGSWQVRFAGTAQHRPSVSKVLSVRVLG